MKIVLLFGVLLLYTIELIMRILIAKQNQELIQTIFPAKKIKFEESSKNTSTFNVSRNVFNKLFNVVRENGYNPYSLMNW